ncbi:hypothetical protein [Sulfuriflexus mobilis]|uniref:hypothetical protein n=1 Tax=Sulfuriflexus mobilis TaxID=1811807 RepID=UPI000F83ED66|nr:hypothetical protein [Sulfuriflexus mobilis]
MKRITVLTISIIFIVIGVPAFAEKVKDVIVVNDPVNPVPIVGETTVTNTVDIEVVNADPLPVIIEGGFQRIPFQRQQQSSQVPDTISVTHHYPVPDGYTLVIESFSVLTTVPSSQVLFRSSVTTTASANSAEHHFDLPELAVIGTSRYYRGLHSVRLYADSGTNVSITIAKQDVFTGTLTVFSSISGYLIPEGATRLGP